MTPLKLTSWFRARMLPLVAASWLVGAIAAPTAFYVQKKREITQAAHADAARVAAVLVEVVQQRPRLWRYDSTKLVERLEAEGLGRLAGLVLRDELGAAIPLEHRPPQLDPSQIVWARADVIVGKTVKATVWAGADARPLRSGTLSLAVVFAALSSLLAVVMYLVPVHAIATAERRISLLMGQLALTLQENERRRIARDLHDGAGQALTAARLHLLALRRATVDVEGGDDDPGRNQPGASARVGGGLSGQIDAVARHVDEALEEVRRSTTVLMPPALSELGLAAAIGRHCEAFASAAHLKVTCDADEHVSPLAAHIELACYRIVQEALNNTARHAGATQAWVRLHTSPDELRLTVEDDGVGLEANHPNGGGLQSIRERAKMLGGVAHVARAGAGARIEVVLPLAPVDEEPS